MGDFGDWLNGVSRCQPKTLEIATGRKQGELFTTEAKSPVN
jgi:hypothetical protein